MLKLYNSLSRRIELFTPIEPGQVRMYSCGPTVYRYIHIGNLRTFLMADWLRRTLAGQGYAVRHVKNITDVGHMRVELLDRGEDKLIAQARKEGKTSAQIAVFYTEAFLDDERALNILPAHVFPRATEHIAEMITIVQSLLAKGLAYEAGGNVFFAVRRFPAYGQLSGNLLEQMLAGVRDMADPFRRNPEDFPLWKLAEPGREMAWESPWGRGFPGWHIECSAMAIKHLGEQFDIHTGGVDNLFPHHEDEIAQSEGHTGKRFVNYWLHAQHLLADGQKMAKSAGNAYTRADIEARGFEPMALRLLFAMVHYRSRLNFTFSALRAAQTALGRLRAALRRLAADNEQSAVGSEQSAIRANLARPGAQSVSAVGSRQLAASSQSTDAAPAWRARFQAALANDLNLPQAMAAVWDLLRRDHATPPAVKLALLREADAVLGLGLREIVDTETRRHGDTVTRRHGDKEIVVDEHGSQSPSHLVTQPPSHLVSPALPEAVRLLVQQRAQLRQAGRYREADALRDQIAAAGYLVRDTPSGPLVLPRRPEEEFGSISRAADVPDQLGAPDAYDFSVNLLAHNSRSDLERCVASIARHAGGRSIELVIIENGSTDDTVEYLQGLARAGLRTADGAPLGLQVIFADHNMGFAAGRNATMRASHGRCVVLLDTSIELRGNIWAPIERALSAPQIGMVGPYGLATDDLKEFYESAGPDVDAVEGYLMAFRRPLLREIGWLEEKFRFYRLLDIYMSFMAKTAGYRVVALPALVACIEKHPHREWFSLSEDERAAKSKKNFDIYKRRWHHGQSLTVREFAPGQRWFGHDHPCHLGTHTHAPGELPPPGVPHRHRHQHWADHDHEHWHYHEHSGA